MNQWVINGPVCTLPIGAVETLIYSCGNEITEIPMEGENWWEGTEPESGGLTDEETKKMAAILEERGGSIKEAGPYLAIVEVNALLRDFIRNRKVATTVELRRNKVDYYGSVGCFLASLLYVTGVLFFDLSLVIESVVPSFGIMGTFTQACCFWPIFLLPLIFLNSQTDPNHILIEELRAKYPHASNYYTNWSLFGQDGAGSLPTNIMTSKDHGAMSLEWATCSLSRFGSCNERVPSWTGVEKGNRCSVCLRQFCPHHLNMNAILQKEESNILIPVLPSNYCDNCKSDWSNN